MTSPFPPPALRTLATDLSTLLKSRSQTLSIAETACGGLLSASLLSTPGASKIYKGGLTLYTLPSRISYAGWTESDITTYDGPTPEVVKGMAKHVRAELKSSFTLSESGTAGPTASGKGENRQPGYVALAVDCERGCFAKEVRTGLQDREANMLAFAVEALTFLKEVILEEEARL